MSNTLLLRSVSCPFPLTYQMRNEVVVSAKQTLKYIDILPPPSMLYYQDTLHRVWTDNRLQRYIRYKGRIIFLKDIIGQYYYPQHSQHSQQQ